MPEKKKKRMTKSQFLDVIDWEGGVIGALEHGFSRDELPKAVGPAWSRAEQTFAELQSLSEEIITALGGEL